MDDSLVRRDRGVVWITFMENQLVVLLCVDVTGLDSIVVIIRPRDSTERGRVFSGCCLPCFFHAGSCVSVVSLRGLLDTDGGLGRQFMAS